jgi:hypothetical protein
MSCSLGPGNACAAHHGRAARLAINLVGSLSRSCANPSLFRAAEPVARALGLRARLYRQHATARLARLHSAKEPGRADVALDQSIDAAMSSLPEMYAMFPMIAVQRYLGESGADPHFDDQRQQDTFLDVGRWRYFFIYGPGARFAEAVAVLFSPVHWVTLEWARRRVDRLTSARQRT